MSSDPTPEAARSRRAVQAEVGSHLSASRRWLGVLAAAGVYFAGVAGYLGANADGVDALVAALTAGDPAAFAAALGSARYGVPNVLAYTGETGLFVGLLPSAGVAVLLGALGLPLALGVAVAGLRRETTWRPSWLHLVGGLGPLASAGLVVAGTSYPETVPLAELPLLPDLLLLAVFPAVVVVSFLLNRLVLVMPLRRREDAGAR